MIMITVQSCTIVLLVIASFVIRGLYLRFRPEAVTAVKWEMEIMANVALVKLTWVPSVSEDVTGQLLRYEFTPALVPDAIPVEVELSADVSQYTLAEELPGGTTVRASLVTKNALGLTATVSTEFLVPPLVAPQPATEFVAAIASVKEAAEEPAEE
jgi:hypothetical protein